MGTKIHYSSGNSVELREGEGARFWNRARTAGFRYYQSLDNIIIPFNHPTITHIELEGIDRPTTPAPVPPPAPEHKELKEAQETNIQKQEREFMDRANCVHKNGDGTTRYKLHYTDTVNGRKYFPVCTFCGHRERYVGVPKIEQGNDPRWTMEDVKNAVLYEASK